MYVSFRLKTGTAGDVQECRTDSYERTNNTSVDVVC